MIKSGKRREWMQKTVAIFGGAAGITLSGGTGAQTRTPFTVPATFIPIAGTGELFPVRRIYCIGRNYAAHSREMGSDPNREPPFLFFRNRRTRYNWLLPARRSTTPIRH